MGYEKDNEVISRKLQVYFEKQICAHITLNSGQWRRGFVKEMAADFCIINENKMGAIVLFFREIADIQTYTKRLEE